jgi:hypothetical protein
MPATALCLISVAASHTATTQLCTEMLTSSKLDIGLRSEWPCKKLGCTAERIERFKHSNSRVVSYDEVVVLGLDHSHSGKAANVKSNVAVLGKEAHVQADQSSTDLCGYSKQTHNTR